MSMYEDFIDVSNFDRIFNQILTVKKGKNVVHSRLNFEDLAFSDRAHFLVDFIKSFEGITGVTYKILFWDDEFTILNAFNKYNIQTKEVRVNRSYLNTDIPGEVVSAEMLSVNEKLSYGLIDMHFNFEQAIEPSFNGRLQICLNRENCNILFDIYDDRGCDVFFLWK